MPNPTLEKLYEGVEIARNHHADLLLAVGGGSVCDYAKAVSVSVNCSEDPWEKYYLNYHAVWPCKVCKELFINNLQLAQDESENARRRKESMRASATDNNAAFADSDKPKVKIYL